MSAPGRRKRTPPPRPRQPPRRARQDSGSLLPTGSLQTSQPTADQGLVPATQPYEYEVPLPLPNNFAVESSLNPTTHACSDSSREKDASAAGHGHDSDVVSRTEAKTHNQERHHNDDEHAEPDKCTEYPNQPGDPVDSPATAVDIVGHYDPFTATEPCEYEVPVVRSANKGLRPVSSPEDKSEIWLTVGSDGYVMVPYAETVQRIGSGLATEDSISAQSALPTPIATHSTELEAVSQQKLQSLQVPRGAKHKLRARKKVGSQQSLPDVDPSESLQLFTEGEKKAKSKKPVRRSKSYDDQLLSPTLVINTRQDHTTHTVSKLPAPLPNHPSKLVSRRSGPISPTAKLCPPKPAPARPPPPVLKPKKPADDSTLQYDYVDIDAPRVVVGRTTVVQRKRADIQAESRTELENSG